MVRLPKSPACAVCRNEHRPKIEALVVGGASQSSVGKRFGLNKHVMSRHFKAHVSRERRATLIAGPAKVEDLINRAADESRSVLEYLAIVRSVIFNQFLAAAEAGDRPSVWSGGGRLIEVLRTTATLTGELREVAGLTINGNVNVQNIFASPEFISLQSGLLRLARSHPAARADIIELLRGLDATPSAAKPNGLARSPLTIEAEAQHV